MHDRDLETGEPEVIDCTRFGSGAYSILFGSSTSASRQTPSSSCASRPLVCSSGFRAYKFWRKKNCILISLGGVPSRAPPLRASPEREADIPVYAFVDCDPYGIANIYRSLKSAAATPPT